MHANSTIFLSEASKYKIYGGTDMKYCTGCGAKLEDNSKFCTVCGTPVEAGFDAGPASYTDEEPIYPVKKKKKFPLWLVIVLAAVVLVGAVGYFTVSRGVFTSAPAQFVEKTDEVVAPVVETVAKVITGDKSLLEAKTSDINTDIIVSGSFPSTGLSAADELLEGAAVTFQVNAQEGQDPLLGLKLSLGGSDVLSGFFKVGAESLGLCLPELDDQYYSIEYEDIPEILEKYGIDSEQLQLAAGTAEGLAGSLVDMDTEEVQAVLQKYVDIIYDAVNKDNTTRENGTVKYDVLDGDIKCTIITFKPSEDDIEKAVTRFVETLQDDDDLRDIIKALLEKYSPNDAKELMDEYDAEVKDMDKNIDDWVEEISDLELVFTIGCKGDRVYSFKVIDCDGNGLGYESDGLSIKERSDVLISYEDDDATAMVMNSYKLDGTKVVGELECDRAFAGTDFSADYEISLKDKSALNIPYGEYSFKVGGNRYTVEVGPDDDGSMHEISFKLNGEKVVLNVLSTDEESTIKEPTGKQKKITADNIEEVIGGMAAEAYEILSNIYA